MVDETTARRRAPRALEALRDPGPLLFTGQTISLIGDAAFITALGWKTFLRQWVSPGYFILFSPRRPRRRVPPAFGGMVPSESSIRPRSALADGSASLAERADRAGGRSDAEVHVEE